MAKRKTRRAASLLGYTLVEAMVATLLVAIGVVAVFGGIRALSMAQTKAKTADLLQRLALEEFNQLGAVQDPTTAATGGDFSDWGYPDITWTIDLQTTTVTNLDQITVTATMVNGSDNESQKVSGLLYIPPSTATSAAGGSTPGAAGQ